MGANHLKGDGEYKAVWGRSGDYRKKTMQGIKAKSERKDIYDNEDVLKATLSSIKPKTDANGNAIIAGSKAHIARYTLDKFTGGSSPYPNHAHHMIPANAFINQFTTEQREILLKIDYDVNNGNNLIFLPSTLQATRYHFLPWHQTDDYHRKYSKEVKDAATSIEDKINKVLDKQKPCEDGEDPPKDITEDLVKYENDLWNLIVGMGPKSINEIKINSGRIK